MNIPNEAVEAAARAAYEVTPAELFGDDSPVAWEQLSDSPLGQVQKDRELRRARQALEAAAPHMLMRGGESYQAQFKQNNLGEWHGGAPK